MHERGRHPEAGSNYVIYNVDVLNVLLGHEDLITQSLSPEDKAKGAEKNISGFFDYLFGNVKNSQLSIAFDSIPLLRIQKGREFFGIVLANKQNTDFDFADGTTGEVIIPRGTSVIDIQIPRVDFQDSRTAIVAPRVINESFSLLADHLFKNGKVPSFVTGLTHPRLGKLARRWNFSVEEQPFPKEVYRLMDMGLGDNSVDPLDASRLEAFKNQVLVYQPTSEFINNFLEKKMWYI